MLLCRFSKSERESKNPQQAAPARCWVLGLVGFEPTTPCTRGKCATKLRYSPSRLRMSNVGHYFAYFASTGKQFATTPVWVACRFRVLNRAAETWVDWTQRTASCESWVAFSKFSFVLIRAR